MLAPITRSSWPDPELHFPFVSGYEQPLEAMVAKKERSPDKKHGYNADPAAAHGEDPDTGEPATKKHASDEEVLSSGSDSPQGGSDNREGRKISRPDGVFNAMAKNTLSSRGCSQSNGRTPNDFYFMQLIGEGAISFIFRSREVNTGHPYAIKVLDKNEIVKLKKLNYVSREKRVMAYLTYLARGHPNLVSLYCTFQDAERLYFVMTLAERGDLYRLLKAVGPLESGPARFYITEIVAGLGFMHDHGIVHRDLKPENVLIAKSGHVLISDLETAKAFGKSPASAAINDVAFPEEDDDPNLIEEARKKEENRGDRSSFVGTAQYISPEVVQGLPVGPECDYWALGAIMCQMLSGRPPFCAENEFKTMEQILKGTYVMPKSLTDKEQKIVSEFLVVEQKDRLGSVERGGLRAVKEHTYFMDVEWEQLENLPPPTFGEEPRLTWDDDEDVVNAQAQTGLEREHMKHLILDCFDAELRAQSFAMDSDEDQDQQSFEGSESLPNSLDIPFSEASFNTDSTGLSENSFIVDLRDRETRVLQQAENHEFHRFVQNELILKNGRLDKRRGLFARRREFLLTTGPYLFYVDPFDMVFKGRIPINRDTTVEIKNFKNFCVNTPGRVYYLSDPARNAPQWELAINAVRDFYFPPPPAESTGSSSAS
ncbi:hypothetical protein L596_002190 [Steinernema carpocapsae]|uniref:3-phosphoinositide-dependent protein kinase 1 n=1 Tax=Steinernema carpocapsae TaxID=34508 RepID=A0A4U8UQH2_STECR|nr:hypothetical protein L596_002190 [Steinernema carpocapsae]